jgi:hypothetical protein
MTEQAKGSDSEQLAAALRQVRGVEVTETRLLAHEMRPAHLEGVESDRGRLDPPAWSREWDRRGALPEAHLHYRLDVDGFVRALESALNDEVAGYSLRLNQHGRTIRTVDWNWAKEPQDTAEGWTPDITGCMWRASASRSPRSP